MTHRQESKHESVAKLSYLLLDVIGENDSYPTPEEIAAHKRIANMRSKYPNLTFLNHSKLEQLKELGNAN